MVGASGATNGEANALFVSPKKTERRLTHIHHKLGLRTSAQLAGVAVGRRWAL
jgi:hypothetical protein